MKHKSNDEILKEFLKNLVSNQQPLDPEFQKVLDDNFWDLIQDKEQPKSEE